MSAQHPEKQEQGEVPVDFGLFQTRGLKPQKAGYIASGLEAIRTTSCALGEQSSGCRW